MRSVALGALIVLGMLGATGESFGQSKARSRPAKPAAASARPADAAPAPDPAEEAAASEEPDAESAAPSEAPAPGDDLGEPPPKTAPVKPGTRPSPLTPEPGEFPKAAPKPPPVAYDKLLADIAALRSRVAAVTTTLFSSKLRVVVEVAGDDSRIASFRITLDDGIVYAAPDRFSADEPRVVYEHAVAPGHHLVGVEVERYDGRNRQYRTFQTTKFSVVVPESKRLETSVLLEDDSDMAEDFPDDEDGEYDLEVSLRARVVD